MKELTALLRENGFPETQSYIQSGNLLFANPYADEASAAARIKELILQQFGFHIPVMVYQAAYLQALLDNNPFITGDNLPEDKLYFIFTAEEADPDRIAFLQKTDFTPTRYTVAGRMIYLYCPEGYGTTKLNNNYFESKLKITATTRNLNTVRELIRLAGQH